MRMTMKAPYVLFACITAVGCGQDGQSPAGPPELRAPAPGRNVSPVPQADLDPSAGVRDPIDIAPSSPEDEVCPYELDECGFCEEAGCLVQSFGAGTDHPFDAASAAPGGVKVLLDGSATAGNAIVVDDRVIWIADAANGTVAKIDTASGDELGRYRTAGRPDAKPVAVAASPRGFVLVGNHVEGSVVRIDASGCSDQDGDGTVRTSEGAANILPWEHDECVRWSTYLDRSVLALALEERPVDGGGHRDVAWVALGDGQVVELDARSGQPTSPRLSLVPPGTYPFTHLAMGREGQLWLMSKRSLAVLETVTRRLHTWPAPGATSFNGLTVAPDGTPWVAGHDGSYRFDRIGGVFEAIAEGCAGVLAVDESSAAWIAGGVACATDLRYVDPARAVEIHHNVAAATLAFDFDGFLWSVDPTGRANRFVTGSDLGEPAWLSEAPGAYVGEGDATGAQLASVIDEPASLATRISGCKTRQTTDWALLRYQADVPAGSRLTLELRSADGAADLVAAPAIAIAAPAASDENDIDLRDVLARAGVASGHLLEVTAVFETPAHELLPSLESFDVFYSCEDR